MSRLMFAKVPFRRKTWPELNSRDLRRELARRGGKCCSRGDIDSSSKKLSAFSIHFHLLFRHLVSRLHDDTKKNAKVDTVAAEGVESEGRTQKSIFPPNGQQKRRRERKATRRSPLSDVSLALQQERRKEAGGKIVFKMRCDKKM